MGSISSAYGSGFVSGEGGRRGDDDTSEEEEGYGYKGTGGRRSWSGGQGDDDSEDEVGAVDSEEVSQM